MIIEESSAETRDVSHNDGLAPRKGNVEDFPLRRQPNMGSIRK